MRLPVLLPGCSGLLVLASFALWAFLSLLSLERLEKACSLDPWIAGFLSVKYF